MSNENEKNISFDNGDQNYNTHLIDQNNSDNSNNKFTVTPWEVEGNVDYNKLIERFGTSAITNELMEKVKDIAGEVHPFLKNRYLLFGFQPV